MGQTGFAERRRAAGNGDAPRVTEGGIGIQSAEAEQAAVTEIESQLQEAQTEHDALLTELGVPVLEDGTREIAGVSLDQAQLDAIEVSESKVHGLEGALTHAQEALRIAQGGKVTGANEQTSAAANGTDASGQAVAGEVDLSKLKRSELDDIAKAKGLDTTSLANKPAVIAAITSGKLPE